MPIRPSELAAFLPANQGAGIFQQGLAMLGQASQGKKDREAAAARQALELALQREQLAATQAHNLGVRTETNRANLADEDAARLLREEALKTQQAELQGKFRELAASGAPPEALMAMAAELRTKGLGLEQEMDLGGLPEAPPTDLSAPAPPLSAFGLGQLRPPVAEPLAPGPTGRYTLSRGNERNTIDTGAMRQQQRAQVEPGINAQVESARPQDRAARLAAAQGVLSNPALAANPAAAQAAFELSSSNQLQRESSERNARAMSAQSAQRGQGIEQMRVYRVTQDIQNKIAQRYGLNQLNEQDRAATEAIELMDSGNPIAQGDAFLSHLRAQQGARPTDRDLAFQLKQGGLEERLKNAITQTMSGNYSPEYAEIFRQAATIQKAVIAQRRQQIGQAAYNAMLSSTQLRQMGVPPEVIKEYANEAVAFVRGSASLPQEPGPGVGDGGGSSVSISARGDIVPGDLLDPDEVE